MQSTPYFSFRLGETLLGLPAKQVFEVSRTAELTRLPFAEPHVLGLINLRGTLAVGIDLVRCLHMRPVALPTQAADDGHLWVFVQSHQGLLGLRVDAVCDIHAVQPKDLAATPVDMEGVLGRMVCATVALPGALLHVLSLDDVPLQSAPAALA